MPALWETAVALRLPVFPCLADKRPACAHGFKEATTDARQIRDLFRSHQSAALIGVPTGAISGFDILDLDPAKHPAEVRAWVHNNKPLLPETRAHRTQSGGVHYLFEHLNGLKKWEARPTLGIDGRADGGYVIWWPATGLPTNGRDIMRWPGDLVRQFMKKPPDPAKPRPIPRVSEPRLERVVRRVALASNGERNALLFWASCRVGEWIDIGQMPREVGESALLYAARHAGLPDVEAIPTILSGFNRPA